MQDTMFGLTQISIYHRVRKVRETHIMLDCRATIMAFIECTDLHAAVSSHANFVCLYKKILN